MRLLLRGMAVLALGLSALALGASPASAHADLASSNPAEGQVVPAPPPHVLLTFTKNIDVVGDELTVTVDGKPAPGKTKVADATVTFTPEPAFPPSGHVEINWKVRAGDAHPRTGVVMFMIGTGNGAAMSTSTTVMDHSMHQMDPPPAAAASSSPPPPTTGGTEPATVAQAVGKWITYSGLILALGALTFLAFAHQGHTDEARWITYLARRATIVVIVGTLIEIVAGTALMEGAVMMPWQIGSYASYLAPPTGLGILLRIAGVALVLGAPFPRLIRHRFHDDVVRPDVLSIPSAVAGAALISVSVVFIGHSMSEASGPIGWTADAVHTFAAGVWAGGVIVLGLVLARRAAKRRRLHAAELAVRFTPLATWALVAIGISGVVMARMEVQSVEQLFSSAFGITLLLKMSLVIVAVAIGGYNKYAVIPRLQPTADVPDSNGLRWIAKMTRWEATVMLSILALTAFLVDAGQT